MKIPRLIRVLGLWLALTFALSAGAGPFTNGGGFGGGGGAVVSFPLLAPDGTAAAPIFARSLAPGTGLYWPTASSMRFTVASADQLAFGTQFIWIMSNQAQIQMGAVQDTGFSRNAAGVVEINNGTAGTFRDLIARSLFTQSSGPQPAVGTTQAYMFLQSSTIPAMGMVDSSRTANNKITDFSFAGGILAGRFVNDVFGSAINWISVTGGQAVGVSSIALGGHLVAGSAAPTMGACGTSPSVVGNDNALFVTVGTGGVATSCAVNFGANWTTAPVCVAQSGTDKVAYSIVSTTSLVTVTAAAAFTASSNLNILCMGR
jgi:hypothetical protein